MFWGWRRETQGSDPVVISVAVTNTLTESIIRKEDVFGLKLQGVVHYAGEVEAGT